MAENKNKVFDELVSIDVSDKTKIKESGKNKLTYLSWSYAWGEVKKKYPDISYEIVRGENGLPYIFDEKTGYMVFTKVTIEGITHEMWLPVMDGHNAAMKAEPYTVKTKYGSYTVTAANMFDINKTIMRCLTKNLAMFGLGLYIYSGEDLPDTDNDYDKEETSKESKAAKVSEPSRSEMIEACKKHFTGENLEKMLSYYQAISIDSLTTEQLKGAYSKCK